MGTRPTSFFGPVNTPEWLYELAQQRKIKLLDIKKPQYGALYHVNNRCFDDLIANAKSDIKVFTPLIGRALYQKS